MVPRAELHLPRFLLPALLVALGACGGEGASGKPAQSSKDGAREGTKADGAGEDAPEAEVEAPVAKCSDGTCFECGTGICPKGFYCDEKAPGGAACGWLPECATAATCACVKQGLGGDCTCSEKSGGVSVSCP
ncbi:MAG: hypothetical protein U0263_02320 [Polyangiaceae bacterium]